MKKKMQIPTRLAQAGFIAVSILVATPVMAQKSADTLRVALNESFNVVSNYNLTVPDGSPFAREVYDYLLRYDEYAQKYVPSLAKSWKRIDDRTLEFELRDDVKFHNGDPLGAADFKATVDYITDPKSKITLQNRFTWVQDVEVLGSHRVRVRAKEANGSDLSLVTYQFQVWDGKVLNSHADRGDYSRLTPIGSGPYKVTQLDPNKGIIVERYEGYNTVPQYKAAQIRRIQGIPIPDRQTQSAELMVGNVDLLRNVTPETAAALTENKDLRATYINAPDLMYLALDSTGVSGNKALTDPRVRRAMFMAVDREEIIKYIVPGGEVAEHVQADCFKTTVACKYTIAPPKYDPEGAKKLLAEAGYPNGFDITYSVFAPNRPIGEAIAGYLRKVGIRMSVQPVDIGLYRRLQGDGKLQAWSVIYPTGNVPFAGSILTTLFTGPAMQYFDDDVIIDAIKMGDAEPDDSKRADIYAKAYDRINELHYHLPISSIPTVFVHTKDMTVKPDKLSAGLVNVTSFAWQ